MDSGTIKHIHLSNFKSKADGSKMEKVLKVLKRCHQLKSLSIDDCCTSFMNTFAILTFQSSPRLKSLKITNCKSIIRCKLLTREVKAYHWIPKTVGKGFTLLEVLKQSGIKLENLELKTSCPLRDVSNKEIVQIPKIMAHSLTVLKISVGGSQESTISPN